VTAALMLHKAGKPEALEAEFAGGEKGEDVDDAAAWIKLAKGLAETPAQKLLVKEAEANLKGVGRKLANGERIWRGKLAARGTQTVAVVADSAEPWLWVNPYTWQKKLVSGKAGTTSAKYQTVAVSQPRIRIEILEVDKVTTKKEGSIYNDFPARFPYRLARFYQHKIRITNLEPWPMEFVATFPYER